MVNIITVPFLGVHLPPPTITDVSLQAKVYIEKNMKFGFFIAYTLLMRLQMRTLKKPFFFYNYFTLFATIQPTTQNNLKQLLLVWYYNR